MRGGSSGLVSWRLPGLLALGPLLTRDFVRLPQRDRRQVAADLRDRRDHLIAEHDHAELLVREPPDVGHEPVDPPAVLDHLTAKLPGDDPAVAVVALE